jgi:nucleoid-associated protein YgaU
VAEPSWTVRPGECFWSIADDVLARAWGRVPSDAEIVPYWRSLIEANRHLLGDRTNEDLIYPGQVFTVPTPPASGA